MSLSMFLLANRKKIVQIVGTAMLVVVPTFFLIFSSSENNMGDSGEYEPFTGEFTEGLPIFKEIKGRGNISDEIAQFAVGVGVKYKILPSLAIGQWAFESAWGTSSSSKTDNNFFGITWYPGAPFPAGTARGIGGSEGGYYMRFPNKKESFNYYGYMLAKQPNFNKVVGKKDLGLTLDIINAGGYAASGTGKGSSYYKNVLAIYEANNLKELDDFAIKKWETKGPNVQVGKNGFTHPLPGNESVVSSGFEWRSDPYTGQSDFHQGMDYAVPTGTLVVASQTGVVMRASDVNDSYGINVVIKGNNGLWTRYAHLSVASVSEGQKVKAGQKIGEVGSTGRSTGPHLHFEVMTSMYAGHLDPRKYVGTK